MLNRIEIKIKNYELIIENKSCYINNKNIILYNDDIDNIVRIIRSWHEKYINNNIIGENHDYIYIYENNKKYSYLFSNNYPMNINNLISYIGDMYDR